jgi:rhodanese-related sulfurtransferase
VIDVREGNDRETGFIPGSHHVPYRLMATCCPDIPLDRTVVTICDTGPRAVIAASILRTRGYDARPIIDGGMLDWRSRGGESTSG